MLFYFFTRLTSSTRQRIEDGLSVSEGKRYPLVVSQSVAREVLPGGADYRMSSGGRSEIEAIYGITLDVWRS